MSEASSSLQYASKLIEEKKGAALGQLLPKAMDGWTAGEVESNSLAVIGGGVAVKRDYTKGDSSISIEIMKDSPMIAQSMMFLSNPAILGASGIKLKKVGDQKGIWNFKDGSGDVTFVVDNRILVKVDGRSIDEATLLAYAGKIEFAKIAAMK
jgi:hypothetical protein